MATTQPTDNAAAGTTAAPTPTATGGTTNTQQDGQTVDLTDLPDLSTAASVGQSTTSQITAPTLDSTSIFHLSDVPTIAGYGIPTQVVPWTAGAPYMQTSKLPEGTVFIIVGAVLGFLGMAVLAWRGMVAWSLHRSVKRAALGTHYNDSMLKMGKPTLASSTAPMGSTVSLDRLSAPAGKLSRTHARNTSGSGMPNAAAARNSSLFFSPTAGAGAHHSSLSTSGAGTTGNRASSFLPAGYYASPSAAAPAGNNKHASIGGGLPTTAGAASRLSSLNPNHPSNRGYTQTQQSNSEYNISPPDSPTSTMAATNRPSTGGTIGRRGYERVSGVPASAHGHGHGHGHGHSHSDSWGNLNIPGGAPPGQRAPSANLEDLFEHHGNGMRGH